MAPSVESNRRVCPCKLFTVHTSSWIQPLNVCSQDYLIYLAVNTDMNNHTEPYPVDLKLLAREFGLLSSPVTFV